MGNKLAKSIKHNISEESQTVLEREKSNTSLETKETLEKGPSVDGSGPNQAHGQQEIQQSMNIENDDNIVIAVFGYEAQHKGDLSLKKAEKLEVIDKSDPDWWTMKRLDNGEVGTIPANYVGTSALQSEDWYYGWIGRKVAEKLLLNGEHPPGTFLIRLTGYNNPSTLKAYALSIRALDQLNGNKAIVKHYRIKESPNGTHAMANNREFRYLQDIVQFYSTHPGGLCQPLRQACPKPHPVLWPKVGSDEIDRKDLQLIRRLGSGNFGTVFYGQLLGQTEVAVKRLRKETISAQAFLKWAYIMRRCQHHNLVKLYGVCSTGEPLLIVTEFVKKGALLEYLREDPDAQALKLPDLIDICSQVASGMSYLESIKLVHRDLAARNVLVGYNNEVKVNWPNFGLARIIEGEEYLAQQGDNIAIKWTAPEAALSRKFSTKSDVWSYGVLLFEVITLGQVPYAGMPERDIFDQIAQHKHRMSKSIPVECPDAYYDMMLKCWDEVADNRPTFEYLYHFFEDYFVETEP